MYAWHSSGQILTRQQVMQCECCMDLGQGLRPKLPSANPRLPKVKSLNDPAVLMMPGAQQGDTRLALGRLESSWGGPVAPAWPHSPAPTTSRRAPHSPCLVRPHHAHSPSPGSLLPPATPPPAPVPPHKATMFGPVPACGAAPMGAHFARSSSSTPFAEAVSVEHVCGHRCQVRGGPLVGWGPPSPLSRPTECREATGGVWGDL